MAKKSPAAAALLLSDQRIISITFGRLKNLVGVTINLDRTKPLTAIMGPNGFGKSTVLHVLAASFRPTRVRIGQTIAERGETRQYVNFFPNTARGDWNNSQVAIRHFQRRGPSSRTSSFTVRKGTSVWNPLAGTKPERETYYIGVRSAVPAIEEETIRTFVRFRATPHKDPRSAELLSKVGYIMNRTYTGSRKNETRSGRSLLGVSSQGIDYSALVMGAGEQRLFQLLGVVYDAGKYALILVDELDLLLHTDALNRLLEVLGEYAHNKQLQIIFTTHRESVTDPRFAELVAVRHLVQLAGPPAQTMCYEGTKQAALDRLTGDDTKALMMWVEDDVAETIVHQVAREEGVATQVGFGIYGDAGNGFMVAAALIIEKRETSNILIIQDGDVQATEAERQKGINKYFGGTEAHKPQQRADALDCLRKLCPSVPVANPEEILFRLVSSVVPHTTSDPDVVTALRHLQGYSDPKRRIQEWYNRLGGRPDHALGRIVEVAATATDWAAYTQEVRDWLKARKPFITES